MTVHLRPYADADLPRLEAALARWIQAAGDCGYYQVGNIAHRIYEGLPPTHDRSALVQVWEERHSASASDSASDGKIIGFAYTFLFEAGFFVFTAPAYRGTEVELTMLRTAHDRTRELVQAADNATAGSVAVITDVFDCDVARIELLTQLGFTRYRLWDHVTERALNGSLPAVALPDGFSIRPATLDDAAGLAAIRNATFGGHWHADRYREQVMQRPGYRSADEVVVVAPDGHFAAFTVTRLDQQNRIGLLEPVGTRREFRRLGLARALLNHALALMQRAGMERAVVAHGADNLPARELYRSLGFRKKYAIDGYRRIA